jgi:hypothetical protein
MRNDTEVNKKHSIPAGGGGWWMVDGGFLEKPALIFHFISYR